MRYELTGFEWAAIRSFLPNKPRGIPRINTGASSTAPFGSYAQALPGVTCHVLWSPHNLHNRFVRWRQAGV